MGELLGVYAVKHKDSNVRSASRSGGVFTALSDIVLKENGVVFGCVLSDEFLAYHTKATTFAERDAMRGSKYIQSDLRNSFMDVKHYLDSGRKVLFSGTSCQVDGLRRFLGKDYPNLLCVDIVCHGVPSSKVWKSFLAWQERKNKKSIVAVDFRNKRDFGWESHVETLYTKDGDIINSTVFKNLFGSCLTHRPSCYECRYKSVFHPGDITIADYWGIDKAVPGFNDNKGVSLVLINTYLGKIYYELASPSLESVPSEIKNSLQPALQHPFPRPKTRDDFWNDFNTRNFEYIAKKYGGYETAFQSMKRRGIRKAKSVIKKFLGKRDR